MARCGVGRHEGDALGRAVAQWFRRTGYGKGQRVSIDDDLAPFRCPDLIIFRPRGVVREVALQQWGSGVQKTTVTNAPSHLMGDMLLR